MKAYLSDVPREYFDLAALGSRRVPKRDPELNQAMRDSYEQLCTAVAAASKLKRTHPEVTVRATHALALVHGLSLLNLEGQIADWVEDSVAHTEAVVEYASQLRVPKKL